MKMFRGACKACGWVYDCIVVPMAFSLAAERIQSAYCPMCGNHAGNTVGPVRDLTEAETAHLTSLAERRAATPPPSTIEEDA